MGQTWGFPHDNSVQLVEGDADFMRLSDSESEGKSDDNTKKSVSASTARSSAVAAAAA